MRIIPAIDIIDGKCVRLQKGDYATAKVYNENPLEVAKEFADAGLKYLHLVDLDGAKAGVVKNQKILENICTQTGLVVDFGGGVKTESDLSSVFDAGANQVTIGSLAATSQEVFLEWLEKYSSEKIILGADSINNKIAINAWVDTSELNLIDYIRDYQKQGVSYVVCTDITKDGMLQGSALQLYQEILSKVSINLIASGGVTNMSDLQALKKIGCEGAIIGKAIYEGRITLKELEKLC